MALLEEKLVEPRWAADLPPSPVGPRRRRWPWVLGATVVVMGTGSGLMWLTSSRATPVTLGQAEARLARNGTVASDGGRPAAGVYGYRGSGTDTLSLPPLSQPEGPTMPGTVTLLGANCWDFRIDYSTHHWQSWVYCRHKGDVTGTGGRVWQLWSIGPINVTNLSALRCSAGTLAVAGRASAGERWTSRCTGTSSAVKGEMTSRGPYRFEGDATVVVGGRQVRAARYLQLRTDAGAQRGTERSELWFSVSTGLPLRFQQDIKVTTSTPFGVSTYTQVGVFTLVSLVPHR